MIKLEIPQTNYIKDLVNASKTLDDDANNYKKKALMGAGAAGAGIAGTIGLLGSRGYSANPDLSRILGEPQGTPLGPRSIRTIARLGIPGGIAYALYNKENKKDIALGLGTSIGSLGYLVATNPNFRNSVTRTILKRNLGKLGLAVALPAVSLAALGYSMNNLSKSREQALGNGNLDNVKYPPLRYLPTMDNIANQF